jgi:16S rRNA (uracil1498-N3)-methyltransferase
MNFVPRIYLPEPLETGAALIAPEKTTHYLTHVLRQKNGDPIILFNGEGGEYKATVELEKKKVILKINTYYSIDRESSCAIHLGQSLVRGDRMDFVIQKATELGVTSITPLISEYSVVKLNEARSQKKMLHWNNIAISASEQCGRTKIPIIYQPILLKEWVLSPFSGTSILFDIEAKESCKNLIKNLNFRIAIGPESGWDQREILLLQTANFISYSLGPR